MRVSFVVPTRNQAPFIRRCLDACLSQGLDDAEVVVADGLSTDGTPEILRSYGGRVAWVSERDGGQSDALNKAVARASGELIAWVNSDDWHADGALAAVVEAFERQPELDVVYGDGRMVDGAGAPLRPYRNREFPSAAALLQSPIGPCQPATFFRRSLFQAVGGARVELHWAMDLDLWLRMWPRARATRYLPRTLAFQTYHPDAKTIVRMWDQIREVGSLKRQHRRAIPLGAGGGLRLWAGQASLYAYWAAVRLGLRRAA
jgi:glycosyltransferase involved in cell wall biosynthesis